MQLKGWYCKKGGTPNDFTIDIDLYDYLRVHNYEGVKIIYNNKTLLGTIKTFSEKGVLTKDGDQIILHSEYWKEASNE